MKIDDTRGAELTVKVTGYQWKWQYDYVDDGVAFFSTLSSASNEARQLDSGVDVHQVENYLLDVDNPWSFRSTRRCACSSPQLTSSTTGGCPTSA